MADDIRSIILRITGEEADGQEALAKIIALLEVVDAQDVEADVDVKTAGAEANIATFLALLRAMDDEHVEVDVEVNRKGLDTLRESEQRFGVFRKILGGLGSDVSNLAVNFGPFTGSLNAVNAALILVAISIGTVLVGAVAALAASLAAAVAGIAVLAAGFAGVLGPAVLLVIAVVSRLAKVFAVLKAQDAATQQQAQRSEQINRQVAQAAEQRRQAATTLQRAEEDLGRASTQAYQEMADAAEAAKDAVLSLEQAQLGQEQANLSLRQAKFELSQFRNELGLSGKDLDNLFKKLTDVSFDPSKINAAIRQATKGKSGASDTESQLKLEQLILNVRNARLGQKQATDAVHDATVNLNRAEAKHNQFLREGISASQQYVSALRAVADARRNLKSADAAADPTQIAALNKANTLYGKLSGTEKRLLAVIKLVRGVWHDTFGPATNQVLNGIIGALSILVGHGKEFRGVFKDLGSVFGQALIQIAKVLSSKGMVKNFKAFASAAAAFSGPVTTIFLNFFTILMNIGRIALPFIASMLGKLANVTSQWATTTGNTSKIAPVIAVVLQHLTAWWHVLTAISNVFLQFIKIALPFGLQFANAIAKAANGFAKWLQTAEGRTQVQEFLSVAVPFIIKFARFLFKVVAFFIKLGEIIAPILGPVFDLLGWILDVITAIFNVFAPLFKVVGKLLQAVLEPARIILQTLRKLINKFAGFIRKVIGFVADKIDWIWTHVVKPILDKIKDAIDTIKSALPGQGIDLGKKARELRQQAIDQQPGSHRPANLPKLLFPLPAVPVAAIPGGRQPGGFEETPKVVIENQEVNLPPAPGHDQLGDPRVQAVRFADFLAAQGRG